MEPAGARDLGKGCFGVGSVKMDARILGSIYIVLHDLSPLDPGAQSGAMPGGSVPVTPATWCWLWSVGSVWFLLCPFLLIGGDACSVGLRSVWGRAWAPWDGLWVDS